MFVCTSFFIGKKLVKHSTLHAEKNIVCDDNVYACLCIFGNNLSLSGVVTIDVYLAIFSKDIEFFLVWFLHAMQYAERCYIFWKVLEMWALMMIKNELFMLKIWLK